MSRIGNLPILIPNGITVNQNGAGIVVNGPKGELSLEVHSGVKVSIENGVINVKPRNSQKQNHALQGLMRTLISNMVVGVTEGWSKNLELVGVGFRAQGAGNNGSTNKITMNLGFSHPVEVEAPEGISFEVADNTKIKVIGIDKQLVGQIAANIRKVRAPDVYKGKGIRYQGEYIRKKLGKSGKVGATGAK